MSVFDDMKMMQQSAQDVDASIKSAQEFLLSIQHEDGYWNCELPIDSTVACDYVLYYYWTGEPGAIPMERIADFIRERQLEDGGWPQFPGGPSDLNASVKGYHALKMCGDSINAAHMQHARDRILKLGGIPKMHTWGKLYLALVGCFPWKYCPLIPAELMLFPKWFPVHIYRLSSWTRNMVVPLAVINHYKPVRVIESCPNLDELYPNGNANGHWGLRFDKKVFTLRNFFLLNDKCARVLNHLPYRLLRKRAIREAEGWMCDRISHGSDGLGAIFPAIMNQLMAFELMGYDKEHWLFQKNRRHLDELCMYDRKQPIFLSNDKTDYVDKDGKTYEPGWRVGPCYSPVWDSALIGMALAESGLPADHPGLVKMADWLLEREINIRGDWKENCDFPEATGWAFEFNNDWYPDVDDSFQVILGLSGAKSSKDEDRLVAIDRGMRWCRAMQCKAGGFAAFDKDVTDAWLEAVPFADHNAILDPPCSDITGRSLETMAACGYDRNDKVVARAIKFLRKTQEKDGSWYGRWGINYIYGTGHAIRGLHAMAENMSAPHMQAARNWLENCQNEDGGWGESCWSYHEDETRGVGSSTVSQTAWALLGLLCYGDPKRPSIQRGIAYILERQREDGSWHYEEFTGTGFPRIFYLKYTSYQWCWPLYALAKYRKLITENA